MKKQLYLYISAFLVIIYSSVNGQNPGNCISKEEIIQNTFKALFGEMSKDQVESVYLEVYSKGKKVPTKMTLKRPNLYRHEVTNGVLVFDGKKAAWVSMTPDDKGNPRSPMMIDSSHWKHFEVDIALLFPAFFEYPSEYLGKVKIEQKNAYLINVKLPLGSSVAYYIDAQDFLIKRRLVNWDGGGGLGSWQNEIENYINYNGILFPMGYKYEDESGFVQVTYSNVKFNFKPDNETFLIPMNLNK